MTITPENKDFEKRNGRDRLKLSAIELPDLQIVVCALHGEIIKERDANYVLTGKSRYQRFALCDQGYDNEVIKVV